MCIPCIWAKNLVRVCLSPSFCFAAFIFSITFMLSSPKPKQQFNESKGFFDLPPLRVKKPYIIFLSEKSLDVKY